MREALEDCTSTPADWQEEPMALSFESAADQR